MDMHRTSKPKLRWTLPSGWRRSRPTKGELGSWETQNRENTVTVKKEGMFFVVEVSDYLGEFAHQIDYLDPQAAFDGAYDEMWGRSPDWY
ncbi:MAG: hypothetical protein JRN62_08925 [Nitrososphaerota archaeon]|nr:hypothetical protein [Nitrososphaerota archaeon]